MGKRGPQRSDDPKVMVTLYEPSSFVGRLEILAEHFKLPVKEFLHILLVGAVERGEEMIEAEQRY